MGIDALGQLKKKKEKILNDWMTRQLADDTLRDDLMSNDQLREQSDDLVAMFLKDLTAENISDDQSAAFEEINELMSGISISRAKLGFTPRETGIFVLSLKDALMAALQEELIDDPESLYALALILNKRLDNLGILTFETFIKEREAVILRQTDEITEISNPVIRVWNGILALPIIGTLDSARTQVVMESLLLTIVETESTIAILDISGVPTVDSLVAQHLIKTVAATRLMGAECIISGIRPEIAQTVVHLGIDLSSIITKATLAGALQHAFAVTQLEVRKSRKRMNTLIL